MIAGWFTSEWKDKEISRLRSSGKGGEMTITVVEKVLRQDIKRLRASNAELIEALGGALKAHENFLPADEA